MEIHVHVPVLVHHMKCISFDGKVLSSCCIFWFLRIETRLTHSLKHAHMYKCCVWNTGQSQILFIFHALFCLFTLKRHTEYSIQCWVCDTLLYCTVIGQEFDVYYQTKHFKFLSLFLDVLRLYWFRSCTWILFCFSFYCTGINESLEKE